MGAWTRAVACFGLGMVLAEGCSASGSFECESNAQCTGGQCEANGFCSFPDGECESGKRFGDAAPEPVGGACVPLQEAGTGSTGSSPASTETTNPTNTTETTAASGDVGSTGPSVLDGTTTGMATSDGESSDGPGSSTSTDESTSSGAMSGPPPPENLLDDFDRPDDTEVGGGWVEKRPESWQIVDGRIVFETSGSSYQNNIVYRPFDEALLDVEISVEFELLATHVDNHPQVHARLQPADLEIPGSMTGYILYIHGETLRITRQIAGGFDSNVPVDLADPLEVGTPYRLTLSVLGEDPVHLEGRLHAWQGGEWQLVAENVLDDDSENRVIEAGTMGFSGADGEQLVNFVYDDFTVLPLEP